MIIGNGMLAKKFYNEYKNDGNIIIFASGVSNSLEFKESEFERERQLILNAKLNNENKIFVYFSTCSIYEQIAKDSLYVKHKLAMEQLIYESFQRYYIFRVSQIVGKTNNNTLVNFLVNKINKGEHFDVWKNSSRILIDIDDVYSIINYILRKNIKENSIINIANPIMLPTLQIIHIIEKFLNKKALYNVIEKGGSYQSFDTKTMLDVANTLNIKFDEDYYSKIIKKYY